MLSLCRHCLAENKRFVGKTVYVPKGRVRIADREVVARLRLKGWPVSRIAAQIGVTPRRISQIFKEPTR